jgi:hypothetical protein
MTLQDWLDTVDYKITEGSKFEWECFGDNAYSWLSQAGENTAEVTFDTETKVVYQLRAIDQENGRAYSWLNPGFKDAMYIEAVTLGVDVDVAYDDVKLVDIEVEYDILEKMKAIVNNEPYDTRVVIELDFTPEEEQMFRSIAEQKGVTVDELVEIILLELMEKEKAKSTTDTWEFS